MVGLIMLETDLNLTTEIKLYYDLYTPENLKNPVPLLIAVHGYGAHKRYMMREARLVAPEDLCYCFAPSAVSAFPRSKRNIQGWFWLADRLQSGRIRFAASQFCNESD
ncbi:MAG: hypothetical protein ABR566_11810 [Pyrinomonadaceae bacterium]